MSKTRMILLWIAVVFLSCCLCATFTFAKGGGKGGKSSSPHGWSQGEKKGWETDSPPSFQKKDEGRKPSGLSDEKKIQEKDEKAEKLQEGEQEKAKERERHKERHRESKSKEKQKGLGSNSNQ